MRQNLSETLQVRITTNMMLDIENIAEQLNVRPADIMRMALAIGLKSLTEQTANKPKKDINGLKST